MWREAACVATLALAMSACAPHTRQENFLTAIERGIAECRKDGGTPVQVGHFIHDCEWPATDADKRSVSGALRTACAHVGDT
jgi:hypothetical protein